MITPESASDITIDWLKRAFPWPRPGCEPISIEVEPNFGGPSLLGRLARVKLRYATPGCGPTSIIVKFQLRDSDREAQIYRLLAEAKVTYVPRLFGAFARGTLALEDLSPARSGSQEQGCTVPQTQDVLALLAEIHGRFWDDPRVPSIPPEQFAAVIKFNMEQCWEAFEDRYRAQLGDTATDFAWMWHNAETVSTHRLSEPTTLFHGDVHAENLLFGADGKRGPILIDWQLAGRGLAANDISFFLVKSLSVEQRQANERRLLQAYFASLPEPVQTKYGFDHFTLDYRACVTRSMLSAVMLVGPRFADRPNQFALADILATRVIAAVQDHNPVGALREIVTRNDIPTYICIGEKMTIKEEFITYEAFGATGDGVADDLPAICAAHEYANAHGLPVKTRPDATYHLGSQALTAIIATDVDWNTSRFTIDDAPYGYAEGGEVEDHKKPLFEVRSLLEPVQVQIDRLTRDQKQVAARPEHDCHILVENDEKRVYIRRGLNQSAGVPQHDCFILHRDGSIEGNIDWEYTTITRIDARPIDDEPLVLRGGVFTTFANQMKQEVGYNYWARNIEITRSNTTVDGLTHYVVGETAVGHPYRGFLSAHQCANITLRNCFATPHKIYSTIGAAGLPVSMGSYDIHANNVVNFHMVNCRMNLVCDRTRWGVIASNFCKNILLEDCTLSRMDTHMGVSGTYTIRRCTLGHMGLNAIGRGSLTVEDSTLYGRNLVSFRGDYGSTWEGDLVIRNSRWIPACGDTTWPHLIGVRNDGMHDFGYPCSMPHTVTIDSLVVEDGNTPDDYDGMFLFTDPDNAHFNDQDAALPDDRPFPYQPCQQVRIRELTTASGKRTQISANAALQKHIAVVEEA